MKRNQKAKHDNKVYCKAVGDFERCAIKQIRYVESPPDEEDIRCIAKELKRRKGAYDANN